MLWALLTVLPVLAAGQNVSATKPPVYIATTTQQQDTVATGFHAPSSIFQPSTTFRATASTDTKATGGTSAAYLPSQHTAPPTSATPLPDTRKPPHVTPAEPFVLPVVDGLVRGEIRSSMGDETIPEGNDTVPTTTRTSPRFLAAETSNGSSTVEAFGVTETPASLFYKGSVVTTRPTVPTTGTFSEEDYDIPFFVSNYHELGLFVDDYVLPTSGASPSTTGVPTTSTAQSAPTADQPTADYDMSKERYCIAARYCYKELNERCVMRHMKSVCGCGRAFSRNPETLVCERKLPLLVSLELPEHSYVQELADKKSLEFRAYESGAQHLVREEAEPMAFPPLASYEPEDQAFWRFYGERTTENHTEATTSFALSSVS